jgi:hypothetical protein
VVGRELDVPVGPHDEQRYVAQLAGEESQKEDGRCVRRLEVVEDDEQRAIGRGISKECCCRVEQLKTSRLRLEVRARR